MPRCSAWMKRPPSRPWIAKIRFCRCPRDARNGTVLNTFVTAPCRCTRPSTPRPAKCSAKPLRGTPRLNSSRSSPSSGRAERHGFEYFRHGTLSLYAAFNTKTGEVLGKTAARHTSAEFVAFLTDIVIDQPRGKEIHVIADNLSAHKSKPAKDFLAVHPKVHLHFTPTYSSWLNQVDLWFSKIERDVIARGVFTSVSDLKRKLMRYIRQYNKSPRTVKWKYADPSHHISTQSVGTGH